MLTRPLLLCIVAIALSACGSRGSLYLPEQTEAERSAADNSAKSRPPATPQAQKQDRDEQDGANPPATPDPDRPASTPRPPPVD